MIIRHLLSILIALSIAVVPVSTATPQIVEAAPLPPPAQPTEKIAAGDTVVPSGGSIQAAITAAEPGDTIWVEDGIYSENLNFNGKDVTVQSIFGPEFTAIAGEGYYAIQIGPAGALIGFSIIKTTIEIIGDGTLIKGNILDRLGEGGYSQHPGIYGHLSAPIIDGNVFRNIGCDNQWTSGVLSFVNASSPRIINNLFVDNPCRAINLSLSGTTHPQVINNTMIRNRVGAYVDARVDPSGQIYRNNLMVNNEIGLHTALNLGGFSPTWENNLVFGNGVDYEGITNLTGQTNNISIDPLLVDLQAGDYHLQPGSPAIDTGHVDLAPTSDFDRFPRPLDGNNDSTPLPDIGAYEFGFSLSKQVTGQGKPGNVVLYTISLASLIQTGVDSVSISDYIPTVLTYVPGSLAVTQGTGSENAGLITWSGSVPPAEEVIISYQTTVSPTAPRDTWIANLAVINWDGIELLRSAFLDTSLDRVFLPCVSRPCLSYTDDFSDPKTGWPIGGDETGIVGYLNNEYQILVSTPNTWVGVRPMFQAVDYELQVDVRNNTPSGNSMYGLIFGLTDDWSQFFTFEIGSDGTYGLWWNSNDTWTLLTYGQSSNINIGSATNRLAVQRSGTGIRIYANGHLLATASDNSYTSPRSVGLIVDSFDQPLVDIRFDNFTVNPTRCSLVSAQPPVSLQAQPSLTSTSARSEQITVQPNTGKPR